jgi:hypothetical protein
LILHLILSIEIFRVLFKDIEYLYQREAVVQNHNFLKILSLPIKCAFSIHTQNT